MTINIIVMTIALLLGVVSLTISIYCEIGTARKLKEAECRLKDVEAERDAYEAASKAHLAEVNKLGVFKFDAINIFPCSNLYAINHNKPMNTCCGCFQVVRRFDSEGKSGCVAIKNFIYMAGDESDRLHALSEADELLDALNNKVSWRVSKDNGVIREDPRPSEEGEIQ